MVQESLIHGHHCLKINRMKRLRKGEMWVTVLHDMAVVTQVRFLSLRESVKERHTLRKEYRRTVFAWRGKCSVIIQSL